MALALLTPQLGLALGLAHGLAPQLARPKFAAHTDTLRFMRMAEATPAETTPAAPAEGAAEEAAPAPPPPPPPTEYSQSLPFLVKRQALTGYVGDVGFDPLGFSEILPMVRRAAALLLCAQRCSGPFSVGVLR